jgi:hypothetical protein
MDITWKGETHGISPSIKYELNMTGNMNERSHERLNEAIKECWQTAADLLGTLWREEPECFATKDRKILEEAVTHVNTVIADEHLN